MKKGIILITSVVLTGLLILASCAKEKADLEPNFLIDGKDYFPLQIGNYWKLSYEIIKTTRTLDIEETVQETNYFRIISGRDTIYYRKTADGKIYEKSKISNEIIKFDLNAEVGHTWTYIDYYTDIWNATLMSKNDTIIVGTHTFTNCYKYGYDIPQSADEEHIIWLAPDLGIIQEHWYGGFGTQKLTSVKINGVVTVF